MTELLSNLLHETAGSNALNALTGTAIGYFYAFTFVMLRMAGLMTIGPVFGCLQGWLFGAPVLRPDWTAVDFAADHA